MRFFRPVVLIALFVAPLLRGDVTIRYKTEITAATPTPGLVNQTTVIHMKGNKGVTIAAGEMTIVDFAKQEVTLVNTSSRKYATIPAAEYGSKVAGMIPRMQGAADVLKSMKTSCTSGATGSTEVIQGVQAEERDVTCSMTMPAPGNVQQPGMTMKFVMKVWTASPGERLRVPGLWQLSGFEVWQKYFMNPTELLTKVSPGGMTPMLEELQKGQSMTLRSTMEIYTDMRFPGAPATGTALTAPFMKMSHEAVELSTDLLDDSLFTVPADYSAAPFAAVMNEVAQGRLDTAKRQQAEGAHEQK